MKLQKSKYLLLVYIYLLSLVMNAQDNKIPWAFSLGVNAIDTKASAGGGTSWLDSHFSQPFAIKQNWNCISYLSYVNLSRYIGNSFSMGLAGSFNKISRYVNFDPYNLSNDSRGYGITNPGDLLYYGIDIFAKYSLMHSIHSKSIDPSFSLGCGYTFLGSSSYGTINPGLGFTFWFSDNIGLELATKYKKSFGERELSGVIDSPSFFQHTAGFIFKFGGNDTDKDGIYDFQDACPTVNGLKEFNGCPDSDGDGIIDVNDACPKINGLKQFNGCPDTDGDGIIDKEDVCPEVVGLVIFKGCPDSDNDGVADKYDECPLLKGVKENAGCPIIDSDGDGVPDKNDKCPKEAGTNEGCPDILVPVQVLSHIESKVKLINFNSGKATFKNGVLSKLEDVAKLLIEYPHVKFRIEGYTDSSGSDLLNQRLSQARAELVRNTLIKLGINENNIVAVGFGENNPIDSNKTTAGKTKNRRVVVVAIR